MYSFLPVIFCCPRYDIESDPKTETIMPLITAIAWHPINEQLFVSGGSDGAMMFWEAGYVNCLCIYTITSDLFK